MCMRMSCPWSCLLSWRTFARKFPLGTDEKVSTSTFCTRIGHASACWSIISPPLHDILHVDFHQSHSKSLGAGGRCNRRNMPFEVSWAAMLQRLGISSPTERLLATLIWPTGWVCVSCSFVHCWNLLILLHLWAKKQVIRVGMRFWTHVNNFAVLTSIYYFHHNQQVEM
jgi:hypothetical protein